MRKLKNILKLIPKNKRNIGIFLYFTARLVFPDYIKDNPEYLYVVDALLGTGLAHNVYSKNNKKNQK